MIDCSHLQALCVLLKMLQLLVEAGIEAVRAHFGDPAPHAWNLQSQQIHGRRKTSQAEKPSNLPVAESRWTVVGLVYKPDVLDRTATATGGSRVMLAWPVSISRLLTCTGQML